MVGIVVGGGSRMSGGAGREAAPRSGCRAPRDWRCVCESVGCLLELIAKAMTPHPSGSGRCIGYEWTRH